MSEARLRAWRWGRVAEALAALALAAKGYRVVRFGYRVGPGQVDLIVRRGRVLAFVEVKARGDLEEAAESISSRQRERIMRAALVFLDRNRGFDGLDMRFDAVLIRPWAWPIHVPDAWRDGE